MDRSRWQLVKEVFESASRRPEGERMGYLMERCRDEQEVLREVISLLGSMQAAPSFMERSPVDKIARMFPAEKDLLPSGSDLGRYRILDLLGSGGMGQVYLAEDSSLRRKVAVKVLSRKVASEQLILERFEQEAVAASALNHPNIVTIFEIGEAEGRRFIVSEYVAGAPLRERIGSLSVNEALEIGLQVAAAVQEAHKGGVIHRDIKPDNIIVREDGLVKVLDFGLAKLTPRSLGVPNSEAATLALVETIPGMILGTASYMSPEQARGRAIDERTDIWSLGVLLFEMLTGTVPFSGETFSHTVVSILEDEPPAVSSTGANCPPEVEKIIRRALEKAPAMRYPSAADLRAELQAAARETIAAAPAVSAPSTPERSEAPVQRRAASSGSHMRARQEMVGREREIGELGEMLRDPAVRLVTLTGIGGTGKTRLAQAAAARVGDAFPDGVHFVELSCVNDPMMAVSAIAQDLSIPEVGDGSVLRRLEDHLSERQLLLVLDNLEQVTDVAAYLADLLESAPRLKILATSRERLHLTTELEYPVPPLPLPPSGVRTAEEVRQFESVRLFERRARAANSGFFLNDENAPAVAEVCSRLDGLPLAIELAAARTRLLSPAAILSKLDDKLQLLTGGAKDLPARQQTMRGAIAWSYDLLSVEEKELFRRLSVFADGFTPEAAESAAWDSQSSGAFLDIFSSLADKNLLVPRASSDSERRFGMLAVVREFAFAELESAGETDILRERHANHYAAIAEAAEPHLKSADSARWLRLLEEEHDNLRAALRWSIRKAPETAARIAAAIRHLWTIHSHLNEGRHWCEEVLAAAAEMPATVKWKILTVYGNITQFQGDVEVSKELYRQALALSRASGDSAQIATSLRGLGALAYMDGENAFARELIEEAIAISRESGDDFGLAASLGRLGDIAHAESDLELSREMTTEALAIFRRLGYVEGICAKLNNLGATAFLQGCHEEAEGYLHEALEQAMELGEKINTRLIFDGFAAIAAARGDLDRAARLAGVAESLEASIGYAVEPAERLFRSSYLDKLVAAMDADKFEAECEAGRKLSLEQAKELTR